MKQCGCFSIRRATTCAVILICLFTTSIDLLAQPAQTDTTAGTPAAGTPATPSTGTDVSALVQRLLSNAVENVGPEYKDVETAITLFQSQDFEGAKATLEKLKKQRPELPPTGVILGQLFAAAKNPGAARNSLEMAVRDDPNDPEAYVVFADTSFQQRRWTDASLLYDKANALIAQYDANPKRKKNLAIRIASGMAGVAEVREDWAAAQAQLNKFIALAPENVAAKTRLGRVLFMQKQYKPAYVAFQDAYKLDSKKVPRPEINMARLYQQNDDDARAQKLFELAAERDPDAISTILAVAQWALDSGDLKMAQETADKARGLDPNAFQVKLLDGILHAYNKEPAKAATAFEAAHQAAPTNPAAVNQLAIALVESPQEVQQKRALEYVQMNSQRYNDLGQQVGRETAITHAWVLFKLKQKQRAAQLLQRTLQSGGVGADSAYFAAYMLNDLGQQETAARLLKPVLEKNRIFPTRRDAESLLQQFGN